jgi:hypothetical protein
VKYDEKFSNYKNLNKTTRFSTKHLENYQNLNKTTRISTKLPEYQPIRGSWGILPQQNYQNINKTPRKVLKLPESQQNTSKTTQTTRISTNQGVIGDTPPTNHGVIGTPHKPPINHP